MNDSFSPRPLTEESVSALLGRCCPQGQWDTQALVDARRDIRCLLGQLALVHEGTAAHPVDESFCRRYDGEAWTAKPQAVMDLLSLGLRAGSLALRGEDHSVVFPAELTPALSPGDPAFPAWYESEQARWRSRASHEPPPPPKTCGENLRKLLSAAGNGDADAQYRCGAMFYQGQETETDPAAAFYWLKRAAEQGHPDAQCNCGTLYFNGQGVPRDPEKARFWFEKAAAQGDDFARQVLAEHFPEGK